MGAVFTGIVAFLEAVPILDGWFRGLVGAYYKSKVNKIKNLKISKEQQRDAIINAIQKAENDEEITALSIVLHNHNSGELPK